MLKKILITFSIFLSYPLINPQKVIASCNFKTSDFIDALSMPNSINEIKIDVANSKKYSINLAKTLLSSSTSAKSIDPKYKKKFKANIEVRYDFGSCKYKGKIWQNGDWKDHIKSKNGNIIRSLNVKLNDGNILNATKFKLLLPKTRNGRNEILSTLIFKNLGFISPETFEILTTVNNTKSVMLFQEDSQKELLERNYRREGPIFEGDESLLWSKKQYDLTKGAMARNGLENISLSRLINPKWFLKGKSSQAITLSSYLRLQEAYLEYAGNYIETGRYISPNNTKYDVFTDYAFLMASMNGLHGLRPHNRKFYFNSFTDSFEPIYYDGDVNFRDKIKNIKNLVYRLRFTKDYYFPHLDEIKKDNFFKKISKEYESKVLSFKDKDKLFLENNFANFLSNANKLQKAILQKENNENKKRDFTALRNKFIDKNSKLNVEKNIVKAINIDGQEVILNLENGNQEEMDLFGLSKIISRKNFNKEKYLFLPENYQSNNNKELIITKIPNTNTEIIHPKKILIKFEQNNPNNRLLIYQSDNNQSVLIKGGNLNNLEILFFGIKSDSDNVISQQRFNNRGLTGCLNIYNTSFKNISIDIRDGKCEDSLNIINSNGNLKKVKITDSFQDAVDFDYSEINIENVEILNAGNDCFDLSGGKYLIKNGSFQNCSDKAISIGEKSTLKAHLINIDNSNIGVAVKDFSSFISTNTNIFNTPRCIDLFQKKQEFGGAYAEIDKLDCSGTINSDIQSKIKYKK
tara:strand:+ start:938 stop:3178 length:2241 start_codon:yes stop_codon:yes gene_type:complete